MANPAFINMMGFKTLEQMQKHDLTNGNFLSTYPRTKFIQEIEKKGYISGFESRWIRPDGTVIYLRENTRVVRDQQGKTLFFDGVIEDITARREWEEQLLQQKEKAQAYLDIAGVMIVALNPQAEVILANQKACKILGYKQVEILGKKWFEHFIPETQRERVRKTYQQLMAGEMDLFENYENSVLTKKGKERVIAWHNTILRNKSGTITGTLSSGEDITEFKQFQKRLLESEKRFRTITEDSADAIFITDYQGNFQYVNKSACQIFGYSKKELLKEQILNLAHPDIKDKAGEDIGTLMKSGKIFTESMFVKKDKTAIPVDINAVVLPNKLIYASCRDLSKRKQLENELESYRENLEKMVIRRTETGSTHF